MQRILVLIFPIITTFFISSAGHADEKLKDIACRSVHLSFPAGEGVAFYNEVTVKNSAPGTYFAVCGWDKGYYGIQEKGDGKKVVIFSVWDSKLDKSDLVPAEERVITIYKDEKVRVGRFGGEGSGGQSFLDLDWKDKETYRFMVTAVPNGLRTEYTGFLFDPADKAWRRLITFSTITGGKRLKGYYSFVEDFKRDRVSATKVRQAVFGNGWILSTDGKWQSLDRARFTGDSNPSLQIDSGLAGDRFFLATGGETKNIGTPLNKETRLPEVNEPRVPPNKLPEPPSIQKQ